MKSRHNLPRKTFKLACAGALLFNMTFAQSDALQTDAQTAEFGGQCTVGLAQGQHVTTDCKISTIFDGKTYCFGSPAAQNAFLKNPQKYVKGARTVVAKQKNETVANLTANTEFDGMCTQGLAEGKRVQTTCKITTVFDGKTYCFSNEGAKQAFLSNPKRHLERAKDHYSAGTVKETGQAMDQFGADDVQAWIVQHIKAAAANNGGMYLVHDSLTGEKIPLNFQKLDFMRTLHGYGFFPEVIFVAKDNPSKKYLIDFWVKPKGGKLAVFDVRIYKSPKLRDGEWGLVKRQPKPWWWIPASEHPGETEEKRSWEVMSAIEEHIMISKGQNNGLYQLKDDKTGEMIPLEFIGVHQPVRKLNAGGKYFACTDFRREGRQNEIYDIDFWLDENTGDIKVGSVRVHKVPTLKDGDIIQVPRYNHDPAKTSIVP
jgi:YHS domain-containing protein